MRFRSTRLEEHKRINWKDQIKLPTKKEHDSFMKKLIDIEDKDRAALEKKAKKDGRSLKNYIEKVLKDKAKQKL